MILVTAVSKLAKATHGTKSMNAVPTAIIVRTQRSSLLFHKHVMLPNRLSLATVDVTTGNTIQRLVDGTWETVVSKVARCINGIQANIAAPMDTTVQIHL